MTKIVVDYIDYPDDCKYCSKYKHDIDCCWKDDIEMPTYIYLCSNPERVWDDETGNVPMCCYDNEKSGIPKFCPLKEKV